MVSTRNPSPAGDNAARLARVSAMVTDAVALLNAAMDEIKIDLDHGDADERDAARPPQRDPEQPG